MQGDAEVLQSLLHVGVNLTAVRDRRRMLDTILTEARKLARAEAGSFYVVRKDRLKFVAAQNDRLGTPKVVEGLLDKETAVSQDSLAGFVASTGRVVNIPDAYALPPDAPYRHNRAFDEATGYRTVSILAIPLTCPNGECVGVLQLINCIGPGGGVIPFPSAESSGLSSLAAMAAVTVHNVLLQERLKQAHLDSIIRLSTAAEFRTAEIGDHIRRVSSHSAAIARAMGLDDDTVELMECASPMHDIGKIGIPDAVLLKPGPLTPEERQVLERHTVIGAEILGEPQNELIAAAREIALTHHERFDSNGYPNGLAGEKIPLAGRIVAVVDVFDALLSKRCYKAPMPVEKAVDIIRGEHGRQFDPDITRTFFEVQDEMVQSYRAASSPAD